MIRICTESDIPAIFEIINDAALAYHGVIPDDCWKDPYMSESELRREIADGVEFFGYSDGGMLIGVMGLQHVDDVALIRHAYVRTTNRGTGIGKLLLAHLRMQARARLLVGTWAAASWAIAFYQKHGFVTNPPVESRRLLLRYWKITERQLETSVALSDSQGNGGTPHANRRPA